MRGLRSLVVVVVLVVDSLVMSVDCQVKLVPLKQLLQATDSFA